MDKASLVGLDIETGSQVVSALNSAGITLKVALWIITPEYDDGRLVLASLNLDQTHPLRAYEKVAEILNGESFYDRPQLLILRMKDPFVQALRRSFGAGKSMLGKRLGGQTIGSRFISEAYVYKIES